jgi:hypothetical protein
MGATTGARPIQQTTLPDGAPSWGSGWKKAMHDWYDRSFQIQAHGASMARRTNYIDLDPTGGQLLFVEHGRAPEANIRKWQDRLTPLWKRISGGCHLNRPIQTLIEAAGFDIGQIETGYIKGPKPMAYFYEGRAKPR